MLVVLTVSGIISLNFEAFIEAAIAVLMPVLPLVASIKQSPF